MQENLSARIVVKVNARQDRVQVTRFAPGTLVGTLRTYRHVTPSSINRLFRVLGAQLRPVEDGPAAGAWEADMLIPAPVRRANRARPVGCATLAQRLRESRLRPGSLRFRLRGTDALFVGLGPRRRTRHYLGPVTMHFLHRRRCLAAQCLRSGYRQLCAGVWYDPAGDVAYVQSGLSLTECAHIRKDAA